MMTPIFGGGSLEVLSREYPQRYRGDIQLSGPIQDIIKLSGATLVDFTRLTEALLRTLRTITESQSSVMRRSDSGWGDSGSG